MNDNVRATLKRDYLDCKQKCLTGYLSKNKTLFQNQLPSLTSRCCCRHLKEGTKHEDLLKTLSGPSQGVTCIKNRNKRCFLSYSHREKCPYLTDLPGIQFSPGKGQQLNMYPTTSVHTGRSDFEMYRDKSRKKKFNKLISELEGHWNILENRSRVPTVLLSTSMTTENKKDIKEDTETHYTGSLLPSLEKRESRLTHCQRSTIHDNYVNPGPQNLVCYRKEISDNDDSLENETFRTIRQCSVSSNDVNCDNVTLRDLVDFNVVRCS